MSISANQLPNDPHAVFTVWVLHTDYDWARTSHQPLARDEAWDHAQSANPIAVHCKGERVWRNAEADEHVRKCQIARNLRVARAA